LLADRDPYGLQDISPRRRALDRAVQAVIASSQGFLGAHWLFLVNATLGLYIGLALLAPLASAAGFTPLGQFLFSAYAYACHQLPQRSFFIAGYQIAFCQRDVAIYGAMFLTGLFYATRRGRVRHLRLWVYLLALVPIALDGGTQLFGWRESTWELRVLTGALFGVTSVWFLFPYMESTIDELSLPDLVGRKVAPPVEPSALEEE
jgi:uncharacterized membrane protein